MGHGWVKARFITPAPPGTPIVEEYPVRMPDGTEKVLRRARVFIPSSIFDNPALLENDPDYLASLAAMPEAEKQALLYGSWDSFSGQVFTEWRNDPNHYEDQRWTTLSRRSPSEALEDLPGLRFRLFEAVLGGVVRGGRGRAALPHQGAVRLHRTPQRGSAHRPGGAGTADPGGRAERPGAPGQSHSGIADPAIFDESRGESIAAMMERGPNFLRWMPGDHTRLAGKMQMHYRLNFDGEGRPMLQVFNTCKHFIRTIPNLVYDESNVEDIDTRQEDHIYDECRYVLMENPISPPRHTSAPPVLDDPLELHRKAKFLRV